MPIYEYQCKACQHEFEREQRITEEPVKDCPKCGAPQARRLISRTSFVLKGGGWYSDLYSSKAPAKDSGADGAAKSDAAKPDSSKPDSSKSGSDKSSKSDSPAKDSSKGKGSPPAKGKGKGGAQAAA
jgi:putative FmdB family regulatory protein